MSHFMDYLWCKSQACTAPAPSLLRANATQGKLPLPVDVEAHSQTKQNIIKMVSQPPQRSNPIMFTKARYKWLSALSVPFAASLLWLIGT